MFAAVCVSPSQGLHCACLDVACLCVARVAGTAQSDQGHQPANETISLRFADKWRLGPDRTKCVEVGRGAKHIMRAGAKSCSLDTKRWNAACATPVTKARERSG